jgi:hypothetical protein
LHPTRKGKQFQPSVEFKRELIVHELKNRFAVIIAIQWQETGSIQNPLRAIAGCEKWGVASSGR